VAAIAGRGAAGAVQRFTGKEHRRLGDVATGNALVNLGGDAPASASTA
jgi:hypothetical protein